VSDDTGHKTTEGREAPRRHGVTAFALFALVAGMVGLSFAAVPLYSIFCRVTGYNGTTQRVERASDKVLDRTITVRFDDTVARDLPWTVKPKQTKLTLKIGETGQMIYVARNLSHDATVGTSAFNVSPPAAGYYFNKIQCFCFTEQPIGADQTAELGVTFYVDPAIVEDKDTKDIAEITLSYAFFPAKDDKKADVNPVAAAPAATDRQPL
jgi:cytochrome c oxidase assembly protein subunit 11